ncbi:HU family DNA-binding protein [Rhodalgimonas zhirmunskyi]|uniref:HU family DNA-binding protein n=1 Tax=Rhodalgimonas zhirmunskyi TaxID=2964767 RepID=UPI0029529398|nr:HU family DNA-binding protein [Rhodoalgimonas zhirmunskyi]
MEAAKALSVGRRGAGETNPEMEAVDTSSQETADADASNEDFSSLRKKEFIDAVAQRSGVKRRDAKTAAEAALVELGEAIAAGRQINLPGFGKLKVNRSKRLSNGEVFVTKIRQPKDKTEDKAETTPKDPLAEAAE